jgi:hypothetical protein
MNANASGGGAGDVIEVYCACPPELARRRYADRAASGSRHPAHATTSLSNADLDQYDRPLGIGRVIIVDTTSPVDVEALVDHVRTELGLRAHPHEVI